MNKVKIDLCKITTLLCVTFFLLAPNKSIAQCTGACGPSLVNNSSFELATTNCDTMNSEIFTDYSQVQDWFGTACLTCPGNGSTPDYYNSSCPGSAPTENCGFGTGSVGFFTSVDVGGSGGSNAREYVQTQLASGLIAGQEYCATIQVKTSPASFAYVPTDGLGLWFTNGMVDIDVDNGGQQYLGPGSIVNATPQIANASGNIIDTVCTTITGSFVANGTETWMVMGNFTPDNLMQTTSVCGGFFSFCFGYLIVDQVDLVAICSSCDATIAASGPFCTSSPTTILTANDPGGTWSGPGITNPATGAFNPALAGVGVHNIIYDLACGDDDTISITVNASDDSSFTYLSSSYCLNDTDPLPTITGLAGGTFSINNSGVINTSSGLIDLSASGPGSFTISYLTNGACPTTGQFVINILSNADATINAPGSFCLNDPVVNLTAASSGGNWSGNGITNNALGTFNASVAGAGVHTITYQIPGSCGDIDNALITVNSMDDSSFTYSSGSYCLIDSDPLPTITGLTGGTFSIDNSGVINPATGLIDLSASGTGTYNINYLTNGSCPTTGLFTINIITSADATINAPGSFCSNDAPVNLTAANTGGSWTGTGITNSSLGTFDPNIAGAGVHTITYQITGSCGDIDNVSITVNALDDASFSFSQSSYCIASSNPSPLITGLAGGTFSINLGGSINPTTGEIDLAGSGLGNFTVTYQTNGACPNSSTFNLSISNSLDASISPEGPFCEGDPSINLTSISGGGIWTGNGITDPNLGTFNPQIAGIGNHQIIYTISGVCGDADTIYLTVNPSDNATISYSLSTYCTSESDPTAVITGTAGGDFNIDNSGVINSTTGEIDLDATGAGIYVITYITNGLCADTAQFSLTITNGASASIDLAGPFCQGTSTVTLVASSPGGIWTGNGITDSLNGTFNPTIAGVGSHQIFYTISGACSTSDSINIGVLEQPSISLPGSYTLNYGGTEILVPTYTGTGTFNWSPAENLDCSNCATPVITPTQTSTVCVVYSNGVCIDSACTQIIVDYNCGEVAVPTAFSPNSGDVNSVECVLGACVINMHFKIYDRWGELVFESLDQNTCWDGTHARNGKEMSTGVYVFQLEADLIDGTSISQKGNITLLR